MDELGVELREAAANTGGDEATICIIKIGMDVVRRNAAGDGEGHIPERALHGHDRVAIGGQSGSGARRGASSPTSYSAAWTIS